MARWLEQLNAPPPGSRERVVPQSTIDSEMAAFAQAQAALS